MVERVGIKKVYRELTQVGHHLEKRGRNVKGVLKESVPGVLREYWCNHCKRFYYIHTDDELVCGIMSSEHRMGNGDTNDDVEDDLRVLMHLCSNTQSEERSGAGE